jgi:hypothetical protein
MHSSNSRGTQIEDVCTKQGRLINVPRWLAVTAQVPTNCGQSAFFARLRSTDMVHTGDTDATARVRQCTAAGAADGKAGAVTSDLVSGPVGAGAHGQASQAPGDTAASSIHLQQARDHVAAFAVPDEAQSA